jgi:altronate dehydratase
MAEHIDVNAGKIIEGVNTVEELGEEIYTKNYRNVQWVENGIRKK